MTTDIKPQPDAAAESAIAVASASTSRNLVLSLVGAIRASYNPEPIDKPCIDPEMPSLPAILRVAEVCRFTLANLEYSLSSGGGLRAWFKLNLLIALLIAIPIVFVFPVITLFLATFASWSDLLRTTAINLFWATVYIAGTAAMITTGLCVLRFALSGRK
jgi:hypothetical protein